MHDIANSVQEHTKQSQKSSQTVKISKKCSCCVANGTQESGGYSPTFPGMQFSFIGLTQPQAYQAYNAKVVL